MQSRKKAGQARLKSKTLASLRATKEGLEGNGKRSAIAGSRKTSNDAKARTVKQYDHPTKTRLNNPPVGLVTPDTDPDLAPKTYTYDPHLDPQLIWAGKAEKTVLTVDTVSLHVHERIDPHTIMEAVRTKESFVEQPSLFSQPSENPPLREALDFYQHRHGWSNRLIAGDSLLVMNSLLEREGMAGQVQMVYLDPPYGIKYGSNFQPFVNRRDVKDGSDSDLTQEPEMIRAFRDTWELGIHSWLSYLRDRLLLCRELLNVSGSCFVQISRENLHLVRNLMDEVFGASNFVTVITFVKTSGQTDNLLASVSDYLIWYARDKEQTKYRQLFTEKNVNGEGASAYQSVELRDGQRRRLTKDERDDSSLLPDGSRLFRLDNLTSQSPGTRYNVILDGQTYYPKGYWKTEERLMPNLIKAKRVMPSGSNLYYVRYLDDFAGIAINDNWRDTVIAGFTSDKRYVVETSPKVVQRCVLMTTDPGDLVLDPTCGSGTTAYVAEQWGRRWITCDTSRVATALAKQRMMTSAFEYYEVVDETLGVDGGLRYKTIPHVTLKSVANCEPASAEPLYDQPVVNRAKVRVTGPFTVEAVPAPIVAGLATRTDLTDSTIARSGATLRESDWRNELLKSGVRALGGKFIKFSRVEPLSVTSFIHAEAETVEERPRRVAISFGPEYAPLEQRQVEGAWREAQMLNPQPQILLFAAFQFDPEAAKDIDEMDPRLTKMTFLKVQMNMDLLTSDLKKKRTANEGFWLIGRPDVEVRRAAQDKDTFIVELHGFDYYDVKTGNIESGNADRIAMWMLDTDYDERSLLPRQVFFPMAGEKDGWSKIARSLRAEIDQELIEGYRGTASLPFKSGKHGRVAVKIVDDRGVESMRVIKLS